MVVALRGARGPPTGAVSRRRAVRLEDAEGALLRGASEAAGSLEAGVLVRVDAAADALVELDHADDGEVGGLEEDDAAVTELVVGGEEEAERAEDDESDEVEGRVEVGEAVAGRGLEDVNAVDVEVLLAGVGDYAGEGVGEHTGQGAHEEEGGEDDEHDHERGPKDFIDVVHDFDADVGGAEEDLCEDHGHVGKGVGVLADEGEGGEEAEVDDDDEDHEFDEILAHFLEAGDEGSPVGRQAEEGEHAWDHEQSLQSKDVEGSVGHLHVVVRNTDNPCDGVLVRCVVKIVGAGSCLRRTAKVIPMPIMIMSNRFQISVA